MMACEPMEFFARCASGFEPVLAQELKRMRIRQVRPLKGGVAFFGSVADAYRACLFSRVATRVQLVLARVAAPDAQVLYRELVEFPWEEHVRLGATVAVQAHGTNDSLRNTQFTSLKVKDALCDRLREARGARPDVDASDPDFALDVSLNGQKATIYLNLSGASLHRRGYREEGVQIQAPLKETLAAGMLLAAGWPDMARKGEGPLGFADPMCGSGTLAIEAAQIAADIAPGILRKRWGFMGWAQHDQGAWEQLRAEAEQRARAGCVRPVRIVAGDSDARAIRQARANAQRALVAPLVEFHIADAATLATYLGSRQGGTAAPSGLLAVNPPYGQRLQTQGELPQTYQALSQAVDALPNGWALAIITPDVSIDSPLGLQPQQVLPCFNGPIETTLRLYEVEQTTRTRLQVVSLAGTERSVTVGEENSQQFASRLRKVAKERVKWARKAGVSCYRVYDADLPDYSLAVDVYEGAGPDAGRRFVRVAEYQAPATVDAQRAARRFADAQAIIPAVLDADAKDVFAKVRKREKGGGQYRQARDVSHIVYVQESGYLLEVDLGGYLDTGLFLDHRVTREMVGKMAQGKRFLNLFAYTGVASVHAAGGGALETTTVDLSQTYLAWARRNMQANGFNGREHYYVRDDTMEWLGYEANSGRAYDLVFCDPPTFSNSKAMGSRTFDVQRDHVELLEAVARVLAPGGAIVFSCNKRNFKLDAEALERLGLQVRDITPQTIPHDFERTPKVHRCYVLSAI